MHPTSRIVLVASVSLAACHSSGGDAPPSCNVPSARECLEFSEDFADSWDELRASCETDLGGTWEACPEADRVGECQATFPSGAWVTYVMYPGQVCSAEEGQATCERMAVAGATVRFTPGDGTCGAAEHQTLACDLRSSDQACVTYSGLMAPVRRAALESGCAQVEGVVTEACPTAGVLATCEIADFWGLTISESLYAGADLAAAEVECADAGGVWRTVE